VTEAKVSVAGGSIALLVAQPVLIPAPAIVCVPSIFGITDEAKRWLRDNSAAGFLTTVYDPFWRSDPGPLSPSIDSERARATGRRDVTRVEDATSDLAAIVDAVRAMPECNGHVAVVGYCFGGRYALIAAATMPIDAAVSYHGILIGKSLDLAPKIRVPLSMHFGDRDSSCTMDEVDAIRAATAGNPLVDIHVYENVGHSFTWEGYAKYDAFAATQSEARAMAILEPLKT
jgi:carboxymethylenebutenolidase